MSRIPQKKGSSSTSSHIPKSRLTSAPLQQPKSNQKNFLSVPKVTVTGPPRESKSNTNQRKRSSSVSRPSTSNPLQLFRRSKSQVNLKETTTPQVSSIRGRITKSTTPRTPRSILSASKYPVNDKTWQQSQYVRVKKFLMSLDPELPSIKPLNVNVYIHCTDLLLKQIDVRCSITTENYKEMVTEYLQLLNYVGNLKPSIMKSPSVPHNFQHILAIWVWLLDLIESLETAGENPNCSAIDIEAYQLYSFFLEYCFDRVKVLTSNNAVENTELDDTFKAFIEKIAKILNLSDFITYPNINEHPLVLNFNKIESEEAEVKLKVDQIIERRDKINEEIMTYEKSYDNQLKELQNKLDKLNATELKLADIIKLKEKSIENLECTIKDQIYNKSDMKAIIAEHESLEHRCKLKKSNLDELKQKVTELDYELTESKMKIDNAVIRINHFVNTNSKKMPELKILKLRETGFQQKEMIAEVDEFIKNKSELEARLAKEMNYLATRSRQIDEQLDEKRKELKMVEDKHVELLNKKNDAVKSLEEIKKSTASKVQMMQEEIEEYTAETNKLNALKPKVKEFEEKRDSLKEKKLLLQKSFMSLLETKTIEKLMEQNLKNLQEKLKQPLEASVEQNKDDQDKIQSMDEIEKFLDKLNK